MGVWCGEKTFTRVTVKALLVHMEDKRKICHAKEKTEFTVTYIDTVTALLFCQAKEKSESTEKYIDTLTALLYSNYLINNVLFNHPFSRHIFGFILAYIWTCCIQNL